MTTSNRHKKFVKFGHAVFELCKQTDRKTSALAKCLSLQS